MDSNPRTVAVKGTVLQVESDTTSELGASRSAQKAIRHHLKLKVASHIILVSAQKKGNRIERLWSCEAHDLSVRTFTLG